MQLCLFLVCFIDKLQCLTCKPPNTGPSKQFAFLLESSFPSPILVQHYQRKRMHNCLSPSLQFGGMVIPQFSHAFQKSPTYFKKYPPNYKAIFWKTLVFFRKCHTFLGEPPPPNIHTTQKSNNKHWGAQFEHYQQHINFLSSYLYYNFNRIVYEQLKVTVDKSVQNSPPATHLMSSVQDATQNQ